MANYQFKNNFNGQTPPCLTNFEAVLYCNRFFQLLRISTVNFITATSFSLIESQ